MLAPKPPGNEFSGVILGIDNKRETRTAEAPQEMALDVRARRLVSMRWWRESICCLDVCPSGFERKRRAANSGASEKIETVPGPHADEAAHQKLVSPAAWPSITVVIREPAALERKR